MLFSTYFLQGGQRIPACLLVKMRKKSKIDPPYCTVQHLTSLFGNENKRL
jgi:hypothetical protein